VLVTHGVRANGLNQLLCHVKFLHGYPYLPIEW
jgi:hypothetical protein